MAGVEDSHLRDPVLLCDLCMYGDLEEAHGISALSSALRLMCVKTYFINDVPLFTAKLLASLPATALSAQPNTVGKSLSLRLTDRIRNMPGMALCQMGRELVTGLEAVRAETWHPATVQPQVGHL